MIVRQFYEQSLGHASYLLAAEATGEAMVVDVRRDVDAYFAEARRQAFRIAYAADTHQHNDYVSGICELPERAEVALLAGARAELGYPVRRLGDGARLEMGEVVVEVMETPGHTPEHVCFLVTDRSRGDEPALLFSGGALLVGDVARPDLLGGRELARQHARQLCASLRDRILTLPDHVIVYPTHVAGSLCAGGIDSRLSTTIGYERRMNRMLARLADQEAFADGCVDLGGLPAVPPHWPRMRRLNKQGPPRLGVLREPLPLRPDAFERLARDGAVVLDCRRAEAFEAHVPGAVSVPLTNYFPTWAGTALPEGCRTILVIDGPEDLWTACWGLLRIGHDLPAGWLAGGMMAWRMAGKPIARLPQWTVWDLRDEMVREPSLFVLDVRQPKEWQAGRIPGAHWITGAELPARLGEVPRDRPVAVYCGSGYRSSVAASLLAGHGHRRLSNVLGGMSGWKAAGLPVEPPSNAAS